MVAYDPRRPVDPARSLTPATRAALRDALLAQWRSDAELTPVLREVIRTVAVEARDRGTRPEELIVDIKVLEDSLAEESKIAARTRARVREWVVAACVKAYFGAAE
jgi:hypothetical protein